MFRNLARSRADEGAGSAFLSPELLRGAPDERLRETAHQLFEARLRARLEG